MIKKLIDTREASVYPPELRSKVVGLVGLQLWFEWRYWAALITFIIVGAAVLRIVEGLDTSWIVRASLGCAVIVPGALLWSFVSWRFHRWALRHRRDELLHAAESGDRVFRSDNTQIVINQTAAPSESMPDRGHESEPGSRGTPRSGNR